jgi:hypothetical protein
MLTDRAHPQGPVDGGTALDALAPLADVKQSLSVTDFPTTGALRAHLPAYLRAWNRNPTPFAWSKPARAIIQSHRRVIASRRRCTSP